MFDSVHLRLLIKSQAYRDWHRSDNSSIYNAMLFVMFGLYLSAVVWFFANPQYIKDYEKLNVLGAKIEPSNLAFEMNRNKVEVNPIRNMGQLTLLITTSKDSIVWVEFDNSFDGKYLKSEKSALGKTHLFDLWRYELNDYVYRIAITDEDGFTVYSRIFEYSR